MIPTSIITVPNVERGSFKLFHEGSKRNNCVEYCWGFKFDISLLIRFCRQWMTEFMNGAIAKENRSHPDQPKRWVKWHQVEEVSIRKFKALNHILAVKLHTSYLVNRKYKHDIESPSTTASLVDSPNQEE